MLINMINGKFTDLWWLARSFDLYAFCLHAKITKDVVDHWLKELDSDYGKENQYSEVRDFLHKQLNSFCLDTQQMFIHTALGD